MTKIQNLVTAELPGRGLGASFPERCYSMAEEEADPTLGRGSAAAFHAGCDGNQYTITVAKSENGNIFGGVTDVDWGGEQTYLLAASLSLPRPAPRPTDSHAWLLSVSKARPLPNAPPKAVAAGMPL